jgi:DNA (cytosine-5)-methyltransferase 1
MNVIDLFSGVGGFSTGLMKAGYNIILANEIDCQISASYKRNHPNTLTINCDISSLIDNYDHIISDNIEKQNFDRDGIIKNLSNISLIVGGPPCQGFSMAGGRIRKSNEFIDDPRNYLFKQYFKIIQKFEPEYFIFENVSGILSMNDGEIIAEIESIFSKNNNFKNGRYYLQKKIFSVNNFGVPQKRKRLILIGSKRPFDLEEKIQQTWNSLSEIDKSIFSSKTTVFDAIGDLNFQDETSYGDDSKYLIKPKSRYQKRLIGNSKVLKNHSLPKHTEIVLDRIKRVKAGQNWTSLKEKDSIKSIHSGAYGRLSWDDLSPTITTRFDTPSAGRFIHPELDRTITPREAARIQSFPDEFIFEGNKSSIYKQIGNAVPPMLAEFLGKLILNIA